MLFRLRILYQRYRAVHGDRLTGLSMAGPGGKPLARVERMTRTSQGVRISGWSRARKVRVVWDGGAADVFPAIPRPDVIQRMGSGDYLGFEFTVPAVAARDLALWVPGAEAAGETCLPLPDPDAAPSWSARLRLRAAFVRDLARATPAAVRWARHRDAGSKTAVKRALGLEGVGPSPVIDPRALDGPIPTRAAGPVTIIVPIHNAHDCVAECLRRVVDHTDVPYRLIVVDDASTDPRIGDLLDGIRVAAPNDVTVLRQRVNAGFVGSVNLALAEAALRTPGRDVVLLNSDAMVPPDWASRLLAPLSEDPAIASVTPLSNDAEILSVPVICARSPLAAPEIDRIDRAAARLGRGADWPDLPTGVGFCMALSAGWLNRVPRLDTAFSPGYGEEVDWCRRTGELGARHVAMPSLFVGHVGGQSFGVEKAAHVGRANALLSRRYPTYDAEVQAFIATDPLATQRLAMAIAMAAHSDAEPVPLFLAHTLGGGAEIALKAEIADELAQGRAAMVLRVGGAARWRLELHVQGGVTAGVTDDIGLVRRLLAPLAHLRVVYSCGVGDHDPVGLPETLLSLAGAARSARVEVRLHDYFVVSPSYCLLTADGAFRGAVTSDSTDPAHVAQRPGGRRVPLADWQAAWGRLLRAADEINVFSEPSRALLLATYPDVAASCVLKPHDVDAASIRPVTALAQPRHGHRVLGILGDMNLQKGVGVVARLASLPGGVGAPDMVVIGTSDPTLRLPSSVTVHGPYDRAQIGALAARYGITAWLIPSIWPETFSFTTHEALATGLPVYGFALGAQGAALDLHPNGHPIAFDPDGNLAAAVLDALSDTDAADMAAEVREALP